VSIYRDGTDIGTDYEVLKNGGREAFEVNYSDDQGQALAHVQNDGDESMVVQVQRRPKEPNSNHADPQWWGYKEQSVAADQDPATLRLERVVQYEYRIRVKADSNTTDAAAWVNPVAGEAA